MNCDVIAYNCKKRLIMNLLLNSLLICVLLVIAVLSIVYSNFVWVYIIGFVVLITVLLLVKVIKRNLQTAYTFGFVRGKVKKVNINVKNVRETKVGDIGPVKRQFDHDRRDVLICELFVQISEDNVRCLIFEDVSKKHCEYYKLGEEVLRVPGARFPVVLNHQEGEMICPICGEFNDYSQNMCKKCRIFLGKN